MCIAPFQPSTTAAVDRGVSRLTVVPRAGVGRSLAWRSCCSAAFTDTKDGPLQSSVARFRKLAAEGADLARRGPAGRTGVPPAAVSSTPAAVPARVGAPCSSAGTTSSASTPTAVLVPGGTRGPPLSAWLVADPRPRPDALGEVEPFDGACSPASDRVRRATHRDRTCYPPWPPRHAGRLRRRRLPRRPTLTLASSTSTSPGRVAARAPLRHLGPAGVAPRRRLRRLVLRHA